MTETKRVVQDENVTVVAAFFFATFPVYASGINWIGIVDPLAALFYLLSVWFWWIYLETQNRVYYVLAFAAFVLALFSKQISVTIPLVLFLAQWWLARERPSLRQIILRYGPFLAGAFVFTVVQYLTQSTHTFAGVFGWQFGATMLARTLDIAPVFVSARRLISRDGEN